MQILGVRLILDFYKRGVLLRHGKRLASGMKTLFYYETTMSKVMDLVMLQVILCDLFQMNVDKVTQFSAAPSQQMNPPRDNKIINSLREKKIDGTNITQVLNSMMTWTETRSLIDELEENEHAIAWPNTCPTHVMLQTMLATDDFDDINLFMTTILKSIQLPFTCFDELNNGERKFMLAAKSCNSNFEFFSRPPTESYEDSYLCVMDLTEGNVMCSGGRMLIKISFRTSCHSTTKVIDGVWMMMNA